MLSVQSALLIQVLVAGVFVTFSAAVPHGAAGHDNLERVAVSDLDGKTVRPVASGAAARPAVFVFTRSDCPIANRYAPDIERLHQQAAAAAIDFWIVFVDPAESAAQIRAHLKRFAYTGRALRDPRHDLVHVTGATIAPEAAVFVREGRAPRLVYRGRIDDRYQSPGRMRPAASTRDLESVMRRVRNAETLVLRETQAVGCIIADLR